jgi:predicted HTH domain antitoxin
LVRRWRTASVAFHEPGIVLKSSWSQQLTIAYGEILTAERLRWRWGLRLHVRVGDAVRIAGWRGTREIEDELRRRGVRIVDCWGAIIAPTLADFEDELAKEPTRLRQSSDNA